MSPSVIRNRLATQVRVMRRSGRVVYTTGTVVVTWHPDASLGSGVRRANG